jgi:hypothetical protein
MRKQCVACAYVQTALTSRYFPHLTWKKDEMKTEKESLAKEPYATPRLNVYGDIGVITATKKKTGSDGGTKAGSTFSS